MLQLGYNHYATQGGDWGYAVTRMMGVLYPEHCLASHTNFVRITQQPAELKDSDTPLEEWEKAGLERTKWFMTEGFGYNAAQTTKPATIGFALRDSPVALLAWIYEKLHDWTDDYPWSDDEVLEWVSIYQFSTAGPEASARIYYENTHSQQEITKKVLEYNGKVKLGLSWFPKDLIVPPKAWGRTLGDVVFEAVHGDGGHFAAHERPEVLAGDLKVMFGKEGGARGVVERLVGGK